MKSLLLLLFPLLISLHGAAQMPDLPEKDFSLLKNSEIIPDTISAKSQNRYILTKGDQLVFHVRRQTKKFDQTIAYDAGYRVDFYFQVPADVEEFELKDEELAKAMSYSQTFCRCIPSWVFYEKGIIRGKKINENEWKVEIDVSGRSPQKENQPVSLQTSGTFRAK